MTQSDVHVHPFNRRFPMVCEQELEDMAESIRAIGLIYPIVVDKNGTLLDGKVRLAACNRAGIEPRFTTYEGADPIGLILSMNVHRQNLLRGTRAVVRELTMPGRSPRNQSETMAQRVVNELGTNSDAVTAILSERVPQKLVYDNLLEQERLRTNFEKQRAATAEALSASLAKSQPE